MKLSLSTIGSLIKPQKIPALTYCPKPMLSIVGAKAFHFSVRNGKRWFRFAQNTGKIFNLNQVVKETLTP